MNDALDTIIGDLRAYIAQLRAQLAQAEQRAQIASAAYDQQQSSYRELEALYQAATERARPAEAVIARAATHLPGRPDLAEAVLSRAEGSAPAHAESSE